MLNMADKFHSFCQLAKLSRFVPLKDLVTAKLKRRYVPGQAKTKFGRIKYSDASTFISSFQEIFVDEIYALGKLRESNPVVLDCGANIGLSALYFAVKYNAQVYAFEADPLIYECLLDNISGLHQHCGGKIVAVNKAVWIDDEGVDFDVEGGHSGQIRQKGHDLVKHSIKVPSVSLRDTISELPHVDFLKIDIEGAENTVIPDCAGVLGAVDRIFIEWHSVADAPQMLGEILNQLKKEGFRYHIKEAFISDSPFVGVEKMCGMDLQLNIFAFR